LLSREEARRIVANIAKLTQSAINVDQASFRSASGSGTTDQSFDTQAQDDAQGRI
jgi:hypothetical protein